MACMMACGPQATDQTTQDQLDPTVQDSLDQIALVVFEKGKAEADAALLEQDLANAENTQVAEAIEEAPPEEAAKEGLAIKEAAIEATLKEKDGAEAMAYEVHEMMPDPPLESVTYPTYSDEPDNDGDGIPDEVDAEPVYDLVEPVESAEPITRGITEAGLQESNTVTEALSETFEAEDFKVKLAVDSNLKLGQTGTLRIWIGAAALEKAFNPRLARAETTFPASVGQFAKITPYAPDFVVLESEVSCVKIDRSGAEVKYSITAKKTGKLNVSATVHIFNGEGCDGIPTPKSVETISVEVEVDGKQIVTGKLGEMGTVLWDQFMSFWGLLIALIFAALLFVIRKQVKKKTGYEDPSA